jgi:hypothetical protein
MHCLKMLAAMVSLALASPALAQVKFSVGGVNYTMPLPAGYCPPAHPDDVKRMDFAASLDTEHVTLASLVRCKRDNATDYILIKTPKGNVNLTVTLEQLMREAGPVFDQMEGQNVAVPDAEQNLGQAIGRETGRETDVAMAVGPRGRDARCLYIGGTVRSQGLAGGTIALGGCISATGGRMLMLAVYGQGDKPETVRALMRQSRALIETIKPAP